MSIRKNFIRGTAVGIALLIVGCRTTSITETDDIPALRQAAERGNADAMFDLGCRHYYGEGIPQSYTEAIRWYRLAAEKGNIHAAYNLGGFYADGRCGVQVDCAEAIKWYRLAAAKGDVGAQQQLKELRRQGQ